MSEVSGEVGWAGAAPGGVGWAGAAPGEVGWAGVVSAGVDITTRWWGIQLLVMCG